MILTPWLVPLDKIPYVDHPEIKVDEHESTQMPFRYVTDDKGEPILPEVGPRSSYRATDDADTQQGMLEVIKKDSERGIDDLL